MMEQKNARQAAGATKASRPDSIIPAADLVLEITRFRSVTAPPGTGEHIAWVTLVEKLRRPSERSSKSACPLLKLATFGDQPNANGNLRHNANVTAIHGVEGDYDGEQVSPAEAAQRLQAAGILSLIYTSPSHMPEHPRWRVLAPLSRPHRPEERAELVGRLNGALSGILTHESWTLSQAFYYGRVAGAPYEFQQIKGRPLDELIAAGEAPEPIGKPAGKSGVNGKLATACTVASDAPAPVGLFFREIKCHLEEIDGAGYHDWLKVGMALHHETGGDELGLLLWDTWSQTRPNYRGYSELAGKWASFGRYSGAPVTMRSVLKEAAAIRREAECRTNFAPEPVGAARKYTEFGNADRLIDCYGRNLMFVQELGAWFQWSDTHWSEAPAGMVEWLARQTVRALPDEARPDMPDDARQALLKFAAQSQKASMVANMVRLASSDPKVCVPVGELDKEPHILGIGNGAIDLRTGRLLPPDRERRITIATATPYDSAAKAPLFEQTVMEAFGGDADMAAFFKRLLGYALMGQPKEDVLVILIGCGGNGKSTILGAVVDAIGPHAKAADASTFLDDGGSGGGGPREDLLRLRGARLVWISEPNEGSVLKEGLIKAVTGGDPVTARAPYARHSVEFVPSFVPVICTNHKPIIKGDDHGIWRRIMPVPFNRRFDSRSEIKADPARGENLRAELPGILRWLVEGAIEYQRDRLQPPVEIQAALDEYRSDMDLLADWLSECCEIGPNRVASMRQLWVSWEAWASAHGELRHIPSRRALGRRLSGRFAPIRYAQGIRGRGFRGVAVRDVGGLTRYDSAG